MVSGITDGVMGMAEEPGIWKIKNTTWEIGKDKGTRNRRAGIGKWKATQKLEKPIDW